MSDLLTIQGTVVSYPQVCQTHTAFTLQTEDQRYCIVRFDRLWQKRDLVFIREGQKVRVSGKQMDQTNEIHAHQIYILEHSC